MTPYPSSSKLRNRAIKQTGTVDQRVQAFFSRYFDANPLSKQEIENLRYRRNSSEHQSTISKQSNIKKLSKPRLTKYFLYSLCSLVIVRFLFFIRIYLRKTRCNSIK